MSDTELLTLKQQKVIDLAERIVASPELIGDYQTADAKSRSIDNLRLLRFELALILSLLGGALTAWAFVLPLIALPLVAVIAGIYGMIAGLIVFPFLYIVLRRREIQQTGKKLYMVVQYAARSCLA